MATWLGLPLTMLILGRVKSTLNLGSQFATLLGLPLTMLILGRESINTELSEVTLQLCWDYLWQCWSLGDRGLINTQLWKSLCNFGWDYFWQCWSRGFNWHSTWEVTLQLCWDYLWPCWSWGGWSILNLGSHFATLLGLSLTMLIQGVQLTLNLGSHFASHFATLLGLLLTMLMGGESIRHSTWKVTLQHCWDYLWQCWSWGVNWTLNLGSHFATLLGLPLTMLIWGVNWNSTWKVTLQLCRNYFWQCWS